MDHGNAVLKRVLGTGKAHFLTIQEYRSLILLVCTEKALHHGRLTGSVFSHKAHDGSAFYIQADAVQNPVSAKGLAHAAYG